MSARDQAHYFRMNDGRTLGPFVHMDTHDRIVANVIAAAVKANVVAAAAKANPISFPRCRKWNNYFKKEN